MTPSSGRRKRLRVRPRAAASEAAAGRNGGADDFPSLVEALYDAMLLVGLDGRIERVNPRAEEMTGFRAGALQGEAVSGLLTGFDAPMLGELVPSLRLRRFALVQAWCRRGAGNGRFAAEVAVSLLRGRPERLCLFLRDVTLRRETEAKLQTGYNAVQNAAGGIAILGLGGEVQYANPGAQRLWGAVGEASLVGRRFGSLVGDGEAVDRMLVATTGRGEIWGGDLGARRLDGSEFLAQITAACNRNARGRPLGVVVSVQDITAVRAAEERARQSERQGAMLASLGAACHHLAQPATALIGTLGILERISGSLPAEARDLVHSAQEAAERILRVLHRLNEVNEYRTTPYLERAGGSAPEERMLDI